MKIRGNGEIDPILFDPYLTPLTKVKRLYIIRLMQWASLIFIAKSNS